MSSIITRPKTSPTGRMYWAQCDLSGLPSIMWAPFFGKRSTMRSTSAAFSSRSAANPSSASSPGCVKAQEE